MKSQYIQLLKKQIDKLEDESFDLEAWKTSAITVLNRVFGEGDSRARQVKDLKIDYSSWMLRDSNSKYKPIETAKRKGKEILNTAIEEIEIFGVPEEESATKTEMDFFKELREMPVADRKKHFNGMRKDKLVDLLMKLTS